MSANAPGQLSPDGSYYWNGQQWVSTLSPDGAHRWNGTAWVATAPQAAPPMAPMPGAPSPLPAGPAAVPPPSRGGLGYQFGGVAAWSIGIGLVSILVPVLTSMFSSSETYFLVLPLFGIYRGIVAARVGRLAGGTVGIVLNLIGGLITLLALANR